MTHIDNIPHILQYGITRFDSPHTNPNYVSIGSPTIISQRQQQIAYSVDGEQIELRHFIPFYFGTRMPMLYNIQHGFGVSKQLPENIVYLILDLQTVIPLLQHPCYFTSAHARFQGACFYGSNYLPRMDELLDLNAIRTGEWNTDYVIRERKQAEFLIQEDLPVGYILGYGCFNRAAKERLMTMGIPANNIKINEQAYY